ncbi:MULTISPECIES: hypothetical protein [Desulfosporosinus]|uniref:Uncharacterized protein n=1 Tax=Desulfosporosinus lacus DSM 15449 TaxID=1121420 RepID=A0A1M5QIK2_9FIRM|nr:MULTISPECIES: hypothetical protein [Desulfosporosinus]KJR48424.1 hypothetical protein UF75_1222 [Desulfosporosinus sp. I2]SHH13984.1 hypothetical protein SAMN02746098_00275 [Desulfosporosinus lacus DSM 15449]
MDKQLKPTSIEDIMITSLQSMKDIKLKLAQHEEDTKMLTAKMEIRSIDYFTIAGYASIRGIKVDISQVNRLEQKAMRLSQDYGIATGKVTDPELGDFNTYHLYILCEVFDSR